MKQATKKKIVLIYLLLVAVWLTAYLVIVFLQPIKETKRDANANTWQIPNYGK